MQSAAPARSPTGAESAVPAIRRSAGRERSDSPWSADSTPKSAAAQQLVRDVRATAPARPAATLLVGGDDAQFIDTVHALGCAAAAGDRLVVLTTFVVLFLFTGSVVQPIRALLLGALSLAATLGVLTWMFQDGHLAGAARLHRRGRWTCR